MAVPIPFGMGDGIQGFSWQPQRLVVGGRGGGSHSCFTCWLWGRVRFGFSWQSQSVVVGKESCWFSWQSQTQVVDGRGWVLMAIPITGCRGESVLFMAVSDAGSVAERWRFLWQSQMLVVGSERRGSHGSPRPWLWGERRGYGSHSSPRCWLWSGEAGFLWQSQTQCGGKLMEVSDWLFGLESGEAQRLGSGILMGVRVGGSQMLVGGSCPKRWLWSGEAGFLMAGFSWQSPRWQSQIVVGWERWGFSWQFPDDICGGWGGGCSYGSPIRWLWGAEVRVLKAVPDTGCGVGCWLWWGRGAGFHGSRCW